MDIKLAKKLKDAVFPFKWLSHVGLDGSELWNYPNLSELIQACGDDLYSIQHNLSKTPGEWYVISSISSPEGKRGDGPVFYSDCLEESLAYLWLVLHNK